MLWNVLHIQEKVDFLLLLSEYFWLVFALDAHRLISVFLNIKYPHSHFPQSIGKHKSHVTYTQSMRQPLGDVTAITVLPWHSRCLYARELSWQFVCAAI